MSDIDRRSMIAGASIIGAVALARAARGGQLTPPPGAVTATGRSLRDVEPRTPMSSVSPGSGGVHEINVAGSYFLTDNIDVPAGMDGIVIKCNGPVALDMRGFAIRGGGGGGGAGGLRGIAVSGFLPGCYLEVFDGFIQGMIGSGIDGDGAGTLEVDDVQIEGCGTGVRKALGRMKCSDVTLERMSGDGIVFVPTGVPGMVTAVECVIDDCECSDCGGSGISIGGDYAGIQASIWVCDCVCHRCGLDGIGGNFGSTPGLNGGDMVSLTIADCDCSDNGRFGIGIEAPVNPLGLAVSVALDLNDCTCARNAQAGVKVNQTAGELCDCQCVGNGGDGIELQNFAGSVECCLCSSNLGHGLSATHVQAAIEDVDCRSNGGDGIVCAPLDGTVECCECSSNGGAGLRILGASALCVWQNSMRGNAQEGLHADASCTGLSITECDCRSNGTGFRVDGPNNLLVSNMASGNSANYVFDPVSCPMVVKAPSDLAGSPNPHANYSF